mgnify:CR=1 FL=1
MSLELSGWCFYTIKGNGLRSAVIIPLILLFVSFMTLIQAAAPVVGDDVTTHTLDNRDLVLVLDGTDGEGDPVTARVTELPAAGTGSLYQYDGGAPDLRGALIDAVPTFVTAPQRRVVFAPDAASSQVYKSTFAWDVFAGGEYSAETAAGVVWVEPANHAPVAGRPQGGFCLEAINVSGGIAGSIPSGDFLNGDSTIEYWRWGPPAEAFESQTFPWYLRIDASAIPGQIEITQGDDVSTTTLETITLAYPGGLNADMWSHVALVKDTTQKRWSVFHNGQLIDSKTYTVNPSTHITNLKVSTIGLLDELRVWSECRTPEQIRIGTRRDPEAPEERLKGWWRFNEGPTHVFYTPDQSGHHATMMGGIFVYDVVEKGPPQLVDDALRFQARADCDTTVTLEGGDAEGTSITAILTQLPSAGQGALYQFAGEGPMRGALIDAVPAAVSDPLGRVVFAPETGASPYTAAIKWKVNDGALDSENEATMDLLVGYGLEAIVVDANAPGPLRDGRSWRDAYPTVQSALNDPEAATRPIFVADGSYVDPVTMCTTGRQVFGGFEGYGGAEETELEERDWETNITILGPCEGGNVSTVEIGSGPSMTCEYDVVDARLDGFRIDASHGSFPYADTLGGGLQGGRNTVNAVVANTEFVATSQSPNSLVVVGVYGAWTSIRGPEDSFDFINCRFHNAPDSFAFDLYAYDTCQGIRVIDCDVTLTRGWGRVAGNVLVQRCDFHDAVFYSETRDVRTRFTGYSDHNPEIPEWPRIEDCTFHDLSLHERNLYHEDLINLFQGHVEFTRCRFYNNTVTLGGFIDIKASAMFRDCEFDNNSSYNEFCGGIIQIYAPVDFENCTFSNNNSSNGSGGGIVYSVSQSRFTNCQFLNNHTTGVGGAVYAGEYGSLHLSDCQFLNNRADESGGAVFMDKGDLSTSGCDFAWNEAGDGGGAIAYSLLDAEHTLTLEGGTIRNNRAANGNGGGVMIENNGDLDVFLTDTVFSENYSAGGSGGGLFIGDALSTLTLQGLVFRGNVSDGQGGGLVVDRNDVDIVDCRFESNIAWDRATYDPASSSDDAPRGGGGMYYYGHYWHDIRFNGATPTKARLTNCDFIANKCIHDESAPGNQMEGAALLYVRHGQLEMRDCRIRDSVVEAPKSDGAGLFGWGTSFEPSPLSLIDGCHFYNNIGPLTQTEFPPDPMRMGNGSRCATADVRNCVFKDNGDIAYAARWYGVIEPSHVRNCVFDSNSCYGHVTNCIFVGDFTCDPSLWWWPDEWPKRCLFEANYEGPYYHDYEIWGATQDYWQGVEPVAYYDPLFVNREAGDYRILAGSPAVDAGMDTGLTEDFDGNPRPVDIPGVGTTDIYDIGAFELQTGKAISVAPSPLDFGEVELAAGQYAIANVTIANVGTESVSLFDAVLGGDSAFSFAAAPDLSDLDAGTTRSIEIALSSDAGGDFEGTLTITNDGMSPTLVVSLLGNISDRHILADPDQISFDHALVAVGETTPAKAVALRNTGTTPLHFNGMGTDMGIEISGPDAACFAIAGDDRIDPIPGGGVRTLQMTFTPEADRLHTATLRVHTDDPNNPVCDIPLSGWINHEPVAETHALGGAALFSHADDVINCGAHSALCPRGAFTVEGWISPGVIVTPDGQTLADCLLDEPFVGYSLYICDNWDRPLFFVARSDTDWVFVTGPDPLTTGTLVHLAGSYDGKTVRLFVDGALVASSDFATSEPLPAYSKAFEIGNTIAYPTPFTGVIDDVRLWNRARSELEIRNYRQQELRGDEPGLLGYWNLNDGTGPIARDATANGNDGALSPTVEWITPPDQRLYHESDYAMITDEDTDTTITLNGTDLDNDPLTAYVTELPAAGAGELYQYAGPGPIRGALIDSAPALITDPEMRVVFAPHNSHDSYNSLLRWKVNDGLEDSTNPTTYTITVLADNDPPTLVCNLGIECEYGGTAAIGSSELRASDSDNPANQITFTVTVFPVYGTLRIGTTTLEPGELNTFTQADIDAGFLSYIHGGAASTEDDFEFTCTDQEAVIGPGIFTITIHTQSKVWDWRIIK